MYIYWCGLKDYLSFSYQYIFNNMQVCKHTVNSCVSSTCLSSFLLVLPTIIFGMLISMSYLQVCYGNLEVLSLSAWAIFTLSTLIALTQKVACIVAQVSSHSFEDISQVSHLLLITFESVSLSTWFSFWFEVSCCRFVLSVCSQCHLCTNPLAFTLSHFS